MNSVYVLMLASGLAGGFGHCIGMCGPVVASYSISLRQGGLLPHLLYNLGRLSTYTLLGAVMGFTGSFVAVSSGIEGLQRWVMIAAGVLIVLMGLGMAGILPIIRYIESGKVLSSFVRKVMGAFSGGLTTGAYYPMGIVLGFLPCGLVYTALLSAARASMESGDHFTGLLQGAAMMFLFGIGTAPSLLLFGKVVGSLGARMRGLLYRSSGVIMMIMGVIFIARAY